MVKGIFIRRKPKPDYKRMRGTRGGRYSCHICYSIYFSLIKSLLLPLAFNILPNQITTIVIIVTEYMLCCGLCGHQSFISVILNLFTPSTTSGNMNPPICRGSLTALMRYSCSPRWNSSGLPLARQEYNLRTAAINRHE